MQRHSLEALQSPLAASGASVQEADLPDISTYGKRDLQSMLAPDLHQQYSDSNHAEDLPHTRHAGRTLVVFGSSKWEVLLVVPAVRPSMIVVLGSGQGVTDDLRG
jgi:hypothetical protein